MPIQPRDAATCVHNPMNIQFDSSVLQPDPSRRGPALDIMTAALKAVDPFVAVQRLMQVDGDRLHLQNREYDLNALDRILVLGAGKAGGPMSQAVESGLQGRISAGLVVVKDDHEAPTDTVELCAASHPVPDARGVAAGRRILELARSATSQDLVITLLSGGGSALLVAPAAGVSLQDMQDMTQQLLAAGATINEINCLRKHCSGIKGGQLARAAYPAACITLALSDVIGSPLDVIASGPTVPDLSTWTDAWEIVVRFKLEDTLPPAIHKRLKAGLAGTVPDTPKPKDPAFASSHAVVVADNRTAALAAREQAVELGFGTRVVTTYLQGEAKEVAKVAVGLAQETQAHANPVTPPACLILGGETTVALGSNPGRGGRNQELALAAAIALQDIPGVVVAALATDGTDGPTDSSGAIVDSTTVARGLELGLNPWQHLEGHNAYPYLTQVQDLLRTGPTFTNVNDLLFLFIWD